MIKEKDLSGVVKPTDHEAEQRKVCLKILVFSVSSVAEN